MHGMRDSMAYMFEMYTPKNDRKRTSISMYTDFIYRIPMRVN